MNTFRSFSCTKSAYRSRGGQASQFNVYNFACALGTKTLYTRDKGRGSNRAGELLISSTTLNAGSFENAEAVRLEFGDFLLIPPVELIWQDTSMFKEHNVAMAAVLWQECSYLVSMETFFIVYV